MAKKCFAMKRFLNVALLLAFCLILSSPSLAAERIPANIEQDSMSMLGHFDWIVNPDGSLTIEDIQKENIQKRFQPLDINNIPHESGTVWLRFTLAERDPRTPPATLLLDMGDGIPATPTLYAPKYNMLSDTAEWQEYTPTQQSVFLMPEARSTPTTVYIRMEGMPGLWFSPMLRTPHNAATALERLAMPAVIVALAVVMLLCLLRGLTERGQWRVWSSLYTAVALFYAIWGIPPTSKGYIALNDMAVVLAPGVALILLSHVARHLMRSNMASRIIDLQYVFLNLPGIIVALVPLIPGYAWTVRYLALWPLLTILFVPTTLGAWLSGLPGARRFLLGTLFPPIGAALALAGLQEPHFLPLPILETLPLWGVAIGSLIIAGTTTPQEYNEEVSKIQKKKSINDVQENALDLNLENNEHMENDLDDPNLRIVQIDEAQSKKAAASAHDKANANLEENLRWPVDQLLRDVAALESCALPAAVREHVTSLSSVVRDISHTLSAPVEDRNSTQAMVMSEDIFELQSLLRQAHDSVSPLADSKNIALSWFMPPHLSQNYKGDAVHLLFVLRLLLESSVRATNRGAVQLAVRRVPESVNPGHLLFTVTDTGTGRPPQERSVSALARAWELAASSHGFLGVESNAYGASISFTMHCEVAVPEAKQAERKADEAEYPRIIIVSDNDANRQLWAFFLENLPYNILEARNKKETLAQYAKGGAVLIIVDAEEATHVLEQNINELREYEINNELEAVPCLAIYDEHDEWGELENIGFKHLLDTPITRSKLRNSIAEILKGAEDQNEQAAEQQGAELQSLALHSEAAQDTTEQASTSMPTLSMPELYASEQSSEDTTEEIIELQDAAKEAETTKEATAEADETDDVEDLSALLQAQENVSQDLDYDEESIKEQLEDEFNAAQAKDKDLASEASEQDLIEDAVDAEDKKDEEDKINGEDTHIAEPTSAIEPEIEDGLGQEPEEELSEDELHADDELGEQAKSEDASEIADKEEDTELESSELEHESSLNNTLLLPGIDASQVKLNVKNEDEDDAEQEHEDSYISPHRDRSNSAYLTSLIDTTAGDEPTEEKVGQPTISNKPKIVFAKKKAVPVVKKPVETANTNMIEGDVSKNQEPVEVSNPKAKPTISFGKKAVVKPASAASKPEQAEPEQAKQEPSVVSTASKKPTIKFGSNVNVPKVDVANEVETNVSTVNEPVKSEFTANTLATNAVATSEVEVQEQGIELSLSPDNTKFEETIKSEQQEKWMDEAAPLSMHATNELTINAQENNISTEHATSTIFDEPLSLHVPSHSQNALSSNGVGEPMPIVKDEVKPAQVEAAPTLSSMAQKLEAKLAQKTGKSGGQMLSPQPVQTSVPFESPNPVVEPVSTQKNSIPSSPLQDLLSEIDTNLTEAKQSFAAGDTRGVAQFTARIASNAESFGLRTLGRLARTVEAAANAGDMDALHDLFPELEINIERNRIALQI